MKKYYIGWDVGAWHCKKDSKSKDAFAIIDENRNLIGNLWETNGGTDLKSIIRETVKKDEAERTSFFIKKIFELCGIKNFEIAIDDSFCIAIDTPLGWTTSFRELLTMWSFGSYKELILKEMGSKNNNSILTRKTEQNFGESLSAIQDQIGSQSSKAMYLLSLLKPSRESTGVWKTTSQNLTIIETYPAPCMRSLAFIEHMKSIDLKTAKISSSDKFDALVCANLAWCFENPPTPTLQSIQIDSPPTENDPAEGWIFAPQENILDSNFGVSYPKLIGTKDLSELLSEIQIAIVLSAKEKKKSETDAWARANHGLFAHLNADCFEKIFKTLHPDWFKKGTNPKEDEEAEKVKKDGKYSSEEGRAIFDKLISTTIYSLQKGNP